MPRAVAHSVDDFLESVAEAVAIVLLVSLLSLGVRTGLVVVISIPFCWRPRRCSWTCSHRPRQGIARTLILDWAAVDDAIIAVR